VRWESGLVPMLCNVRHATSCWLTDSSFSCCCSTVGSAKNLWLSCVFRASHLMGIRRRPLSPAQPWPPIVAQFSTSLNNFSSQKQFSFSWFGATWCFLLLDTLISRVAEVESEREIVCVCVWRRGLCAYLFWWIESAQFVCWGEGLSVDIAESLGPGDEVCDRLWGGRIVIEEDRGFFTFRRQEELVAIRAWRSSKVSDSVFL
jgi:hypothetical protein